jgi:hypothetical protein
LLKSAFSGTLVFLDFPMLLFVFFIISNLKMYCVTD